MLKKWATKVDNPLGWFLLLAILRKTFLVKVVVGVS